MSEKDNFSRTMRIDIPPEAGESAQVERAPDAFLPKHPVIRVTRHKSNGLTVGDSDFQQLLQNVYDAALITDLDGRILDANVRASQFMQYDRQELCRHEILDLISGAETTLLPTIRDSLSKSRFILLQSFFVRKDGTLFPAETAVNQLRLSDHVYLCFFVRDITLRRAAEEQLRTEHIAIQNAGSGIAITDSNSSMVYVNPSVVRMWRLADPESAKGIPLEQLFRDPAVAQQIVDAIVQGRPWSGEVEAQRQDGSPFFVQLSATANLDTEDEVTGMVLSFNDITARRRAEAQLSQYAEQLRIRNVQMEDDLRMAREIQQAMLPRSFPVFPPTADAESSVIRFDYLYQPSMILGGDFFFVLSLSDSAAGVLICDAMGHGMRAALVTAVIRSLIEDLRSVAEEPGVFLTRLNHGLMNILRDPKEFMFVSAAYVVVDAAVREVRFAEAGHPSPLLVSRRTKNVRPLRIDKETCGPALGVVEGHRYVTQVCAMNDGDMVLLFTDGLYEIEGPGQEAYGDERLQAYVRTNHHRPVRELMEGLVADTTAFSLAGMAEDDVCLVGIELVRGLGD